MASYALQGSEPSIFYSPYFFIGLLAVVLYSWNQFNEPSFPGKDTLPRTITPLRYLFSSTAYPRARMVYVFVSTALYFLLVWPGPTMLDQLGAKGGSSSQAWPLVIALVLVGVIPNSNAKWLTVIEAQLRRAVHVWFLVPAGTVNIIGLLEDARFEPPAGQMDELRAELNADLRLPRSSLSYRWARARLLMTSLARLNAGEQQGFSKEAFRPFGDDFKALTNRFKMLRKDIADYHAAPGNNDTEENLSLSVMDFLRNIYSYISWGVRYPARNDQDIYDTLNRAGFEFQVRPERRLFDLVVPATFFVGVIVLLSIFIRDGADVLFTHKPYDPDTVKAGVSSALAAGLMYGGAIWIVLRGRARQIEHRVWLQGSPRRLIPIAVQAGLLAWGVIVGSTLIVAGPELGEWIAGLLNAAGLLPGVGGSKGLHDAGLALWKVVSSAPWVLAGATVSVILANRLGGNAQHTQLVQRWRDAAVVGCGLAVAAALAFNVQFAIDPIPGASFPLVDTVWNAIGGLACGAVIGFKVPHASRMELLHPFETSARRALANLLHQAERSLGSAESAKDWVFQPREDLGGVSAAEAARFEGYANRIGMLLEEAAARQTNAMVRGSPIERGAPVVITGGLAAG